MPVYRTPDPENALMSAARMAALAGHAQVNDEEAAWERAEAEARQSLAHFNSVLWPASVEMHGPGGCFAPLGLARRLWIAPCIEPGPSEHEFLVVEWSKGVWKTSSKHYDTFEAYLLDLSVQPGFGRAVALAHKRAAEIAQQPVKVPPRHTARVAATALGIVAAGLLFAYLANLLT